MIFTAKLFEIMNEEDLNDKPNKSISKFFDLLNKSNTQEEPCKDDEEDCTDILSPCCTSTLTTVFGTIPLKVECKNCGKLYILRELLEKD